MNDLSPPAHVPIDPRIAILEIGGVTIRYYLDPRAAPTPDQAERSVLVGWLVQLHEKVDSLAAVVGEGGDEPADESSELGTSDIGGSPHKPVGSA
jgi:hypothetical protein